jgi:hypothetical protein
MVQKPRCKPVKPPERYSTPLSASDILLYRKFGYIMLRSRSASVAHQQRGKLLQILSGSEARHGVAELVCQNSSTGIHVT